MAVTKEQLEFVKRHLGITFSDVDNDKKIQDMIEDVIIKLEYLIGKSGVDFFKPSLERRLFLAYMSYCYNECAEEFELAYSRDINRIRRKNAVKNEVQNEEESEI